MTNDVIEYDSAGNVTENTYAQVNKVNCISSSDLVNWTDHGTIEVADPNDAATWVACSWAPCATHKTINGQEKFFLYFCNDCIGETSIFPSFVATILVRLNLRPEIFPKTGFPLCAFSFSGSIFLNLLFKCLFDKSPVSLYFLIHSIIAFFPTRNTLLVSFKL